MNVCVRPQFVVNNNYLEGSVSGLLPQKLYLPLGATSNSDMHLTMILGMKFRPAAIRLPIKLGAIEKL
jgi:hypothetical protein